MKKSILLIFIILLFGCDQEYNIEIPDPRGNILIINGLAESFSLLSPDTETISNDITTTGQWPNNIVYDGDLILVNSGDNSVEVRNITDLSVNQDIDLGSGKNPYAVMPIEGTDYLYISCYYSNEVIKADRTTGELLTTIDVGKQPEGLALMGTKLFAANTVYGEDNGSISVIDTVSDSVIETITTGKNPQSIIAFDDLNEIHIICTGTNDSNNPDETDGEVIIIDSSDYSTLDTISVGGSPVYSEGSINNTDKLVYLYGTDGIYAYNYETREIDNTGIEGTFYSGLIYLESTGKLYASNFSDDSIDIYNGDDYSLEKTVTASDGPQQLLYITE